MKYFATQQNKNNTKTLKISESDFLKQSYIIDVLSEYCHMAVWTCKQTWGSKIFSNDNRIATMTQPSFDKSI